MKKPEFKKGKKLAAILQKMYFPKGKELFFDTLYVLLFCIVLSAFLFGFHEGITFIFRVLFNDETPGKSSGVFSDLFLEVFGILLLNRKRNR